MQNELEKIKKQLKDELKESKRNSSSFFNGATYEQMEELLRTRVTAKKDKLDDNAD